MEESMLSQLYLKDTAFNDLMQQRIYNVLLVASTYDAFMLEEDGRIEERIFMEYMSLNLSSPPRVTLVSNYDEAFASLAEISSTSVCRVSSRRGNGSQQRIVCPSGTASGRTVSV